MAVGSEFHQRFHLFFFFFFFFNGLEFRRHVHNERARMTGFAPLLPTLCTTRQVQDDFSETPAIAITILLRVSENSNFDSSNRRRDLICFSICFGLLRIRRFMHWRFCREWALFELLPNFRAKKILFMSLPSDCD